MCFNPKMFLEIEIAGFELMLKGGMYERSFVMQCTHRFKLFSYQNIFEKIAIITPLKTYNNKIRNPNTKPYWVLFLLL